MYLQFQKGPLVVIECIDVIISKIFVWILLDLLSRFEMFKIYKSLYFIRPPFVQRFIKFRMNNF